MPETSSCIASTLLLLRQSQRLLKGRSIDAATRSQAVLLQEQRVDIQQSSVQTRVLSQKATLRQTP